MELSSDETSDEYARMRAKLVQAIRYYCPGWLSEVSEDLVQTALVSVLEARKNKGDEREVPSAYLYKAAYSALVNEIRQRRRRNETSLDPEAHAPIEVLANSGGGLTAKELGEAIQNCLDRALRDRKLAVTLHLQGYTIEEAAGLLKWSRKRTENLIYRGLADLRHCLTAEGITP